MLLGLIVCGQVILFKIVSNIAKSNTVKKQFYFPYFPGGVFNNLTNECKIQVVHLMNFSYFSVSEWHYFVLSNNQSPKFWVCQII